MRKGVLILLLSCFGLLTNAQAQRPKIGLTLSGGGAKGLSHIGILKAIDSAGLRIDVVTGTSMGSIIGSLYAAGYTGNEIGQIARSIDWTTMFSNRPPLGLVNMNEKREYANYALEIPFEKGKAKFFSGFIEGEEIWLRFGELFYPVYPVKDFSKLPIPFACVATDAAAGKPVVLKKGEIVKAIRASMAIPSVFSAIPYENTLLIDGGVVRNFPVRDARALGADFVIGVNLSHGLLPADKLLSPVDMLYQIGFYKDAEDFAREASACNILIEPDLKDFTAASFASSDSILMIGDDTGSKYYPIFKRLADSLRALYPDAIPKANRLPRVDAVILDGFEIDGLKFSNVKDFEGKLGLRIGKAYNGKDFSDAVRRAFASDNFRRIAFFVEPREPGHAILRCEVEEIPRTFVKVGLHFHSYSNAALITTFSTRNLFFNRSKTYLKVNLGPNVRALTRHDQSFGQSQRWGSMLSVYTDRFRLPIYAAFNPVYEYKTRYSYFDLRFYKLMGTTTSLGFGIAREFVKLFPEVTPDEQLTGDIDYSAGYFFYQRNSLDLKSFPRQGSYIDFQAGVLFNQHTNFVFTSSGDSFSSDSLNLPNHPYQRIVLKTGKYIPLGRRWTLITQFNTGFNLNYQDSYFNFFSVGGINDFIRNQIPFVGITENQIMTSSVAAYLVGAQFEPITNFVTTLRANVGYYDIIDVDPSKWSFLSGYALSAGYRSPIGPIEISAMYSDQSRTLVGYVNVGFTF